MEAHEFEIEIQPGGNVKVHIKGVRGSACMDYVKLFEEVAGTQGIVQRTREYYEAPPRVGIDVEQKTEG